MAESYSIEAILSAQDRGFSKAFEQAERLMGGVEKKAGGMGNMFKNMFGAQVAANAFNKTVSAISNQISQVTGELNDNSKAWKTFDGNMKMIGKSESEIASVKSSLQDFATQTIYSASDMASTYSQMAAIGVADTERLVKGMGGLAASAENPAQAMNSLSQQMVQAMAKPEMQWMDFRIMMEQAPAAMSAVAKKMGYSLDDFIVAIQDGEIASKDFAKAVADVGNNEHFSKMATEFKTIDQAMDGLQEGLANKLAPAFDVVTEYGIKAIEAISGWLDTLDFDALATNLTSAFEIISSVMSGISSLFSTGAESAKAFTSVIDGMTGNMTNLVDVSALADEWNDLTLEDKQAKVDTMGQEQIEELMQLLGVDFDSLPSEYRKNAYLNAYGADSLEEVLFLTGEWANLTFEEKRAILETQIENDELLQAIETRDLWNNEEFYGQLADINMNDNDAQQQILDLINEWGELEGLDPIEVETSTNASKTEKQLGKLTKTIQDFDWKKMGKQVGDFFDELKQSPPFNSLRRGFDSVNKMIERTDWGAVADSVGDAFSNIKDFGSDMMDFLEPVFVGMGDLFENGVEVFEGAVKTLGKVIDGDWKGAWEQAKDTVGNSMQNTRTAVMNAVSGLAENFSNVWSDIKTSAQGVDWTEVGQTIMTEIGSAINSAVEYIGDIGASIKNWLFRSFGVLTWGDLATTIFSRIGDALSTAVTTVTDLSSTFLTWLTNAITGVEWSKLGTTTGELIAGAINGIADWDITISSDFGAKVGEAIQSALDGLDEAIEGFLESIAANVDWTKVLPEVKMGDMTLNWDNLFGNIGESFSSWDTLLFGTGGQSKPLFEVDAEVKVNGTLTDVNLDSGRDGGGRNIQLDTPVPAKGDVEVEPAGFDLRRGEGGAGAIQMHETLQVNATSAEVGADEYNFTGMEAIASSAMANLNQVFRSGWEQIKVTGMDAMTGLANQITVGFSSVNNAVLSGTNQMNSGFSMGMNRMLLTAQNIRNRLVMVFSGLASTMQSLGVSAGAGFNAGLASQRGAIISTANSIASAVSSTIQRALDINSPSRLLAWMGQMTGLGLVEGVESMVNRAKAASNNLANAIVPNLINVNSGQLGFSNSMNLNHTNSSIDSKLDKLIAVTEQSGNFIVDGKLLSKTQTSYSNRNLGKQLKREGRTVWA